MSEFMKLTGGFDIAEVVYRGEDNLPFKEDELNPDISISNFALYLNREGKLSLVDIEFSSRTPSLEGYKFLGVLS